MAGRILIVYGVIVCIGVSIQQLWIPQFWDDAIGGDKPADLGVIEPGAVIVEAELVMVLFVREFVPAPAKKATESVTR